MTNKFDDGQKPEEVKMRKNKYNWLFAAIAVIFVAIVAYGVLTMPDRRSPSEKVTDAINAMSQGSEKAGEQLETRTPGQKLGDVVKDAGDRIKEDTK
jgi:flagellar biosynthesis/type III secretory pathway M-ring protein FliF/YscJ